MANEDAPRAAHAAADGAKIIKRSIAIAGHRTSVSLEEIFWRALKSMAEVRGSSTAALVAEIDAGRNGANLSSAIRVFVLEALLARQ
jgi:predicted DNA-binding ribbon-helix-helix protein